MNAPSSAAFRCVLLVGTIPGLESLKNPLLGTICHHSIGMTVPPADLDDEKALARTLRELADMLEAPTVPDPDLT